jgi:outer membrane receptor protein involved in Fe transport
MAIAAAMAAPAVTATAQEGPNELILEEVMVTATKRTTDLMSIPQSVQALTEVQIRQAGLYVLDDYVRFIPSMSYVSLVPGQAKIFFRGIADDVATFIAEPSAALYLDEQSLTMNALPDVRIVDVERIEALSGPQGTLFGASAQAGVLRIITNKPDPTNFDARVDAMLKTGSDSDMSHDLNGMVNIPLGDNLAIRLVGFTAEDGGFIDIVNGNTPRFGLVNNAGSEQSNYNETEYSGGRVAARWLINDDWAMTAGVVYQSTRVSGKPERDQTLPQDLSVVRFLPNRIFNESEWKQYALTVEGDLGFADFVSASAYFNRDWSYAQDNSTGYTAYFGTACYTGYYYNWAQYSRYCFQPDGVGNYYNDPIGYRQNIQENSKFSQEIRLSAQGERLDWVAGLFYEMAEEEWDFDVIAHGYDESRSMANYLAGNLVWRGNPIPSRLPDDSWFASADRTEWEQWAAFGEVTWHISDRWDMTLGGRWFKRTMDKVYWLELPKYNLTDEGISRPRSDVDDFVPKFSVSYNTGNGILLYGLYSEGFRPGGTNRGRGMPFLPRQYDSDILENIEFGAKMNLADGRVRLNMTYFDMSWNDYQLEVVDPSNQRCGSPTAPPEPYCDQSWQKVVANVGNASSRGIEVSLDATVTENLTAGFNVTWLDAVLDEDVEVTVTIPAGSRLPLSPEIKGSMYAQYGWNVDWIGGRAKDAFVRLQWSYVDDMLNIAEPLELYEHGPSPQITMPSYSIGDLRFGLNGDSWSVQVFINNLTDERAILFDNPFEADYFWGHGRQTINRPREYGLRYIHRFGSP